MIEPYSVIENEKFITALFGPDRPSERELSLPYGGSPDKVCLVKAASTSSDEGFKEIKSPIFGPRDSSVPDIFADGVILTEPGQTAVMWTGDCLSASMYEPQSQRLVLAHCGRGALSPRINWRGEIENMITRSYKELARGVSFPEVSVHLVGSICGHCFTHEDKKGKEMIKPFKEHFGDLAFANKKRGAIDLPAIATHQLLELGVEPENIVHDGICTFETMALVSHRRNLMNNSPSVVRNAVMVFLK